jgi:glucan biosynthesis protein C
MSDMSERRYDLDWLRIGAFALLILYHIGMFYVSWPWHVKSSQTGPEVYQVVQPLMLLTNPWRLALLFLIAGCATRFMADKMPRGRMAKLRSWRLLLPIVFGMLVIVPPQTYYEVVTQMNFDQGWLAFYAKYIGFHDGWRSNGAPLIVPTWNHLWFVVYLWVYTMLVLALRPAAASVAAAACRETVAPAAGLAAAAANLCRAAATHPAAHLRRDPCAAG